MHRNWQDLITPNNVEIETLSDTYGKFVAKPLERGLWYNFRKLAETQSTF